MARIPLLVCLITGLLGGCGVSRPTADAGSVQRADVSTPTDAGVCAEGRWLVPGCSEGLTPDFTAGCYVPCEEPGALCDDGSTCTTVTENPCLCPTGIDCCEACGGQVAVCL